MQKKMANIIVTVGIILSVATIAFSQIDRRSKDDLYSQIELFSYALTTIQADYVEKMDPKDLIYHTTRGYWITRFLAETNPDLLPDLLKHRQGRALDRTIERALGLSHGALWRQIDEIVFDHFNVAGN